MIRMILTDLDHTLLRQDGSISGETLHVLEECRAKGILFAIATARYWIGEVGGFRVYKYAIPVLFGSIRDRFRTGDKPFADAFLTMVKGDFTWRFTEFMNELLFRTPDSAIL